MTLLTHKMSRGRGFPQRVILVGGYGHGNLGDNLLAEVTARELRLQGLSVIVSAGHLGSLDHEWTQSRALLGRNLRSNDLLLLAGGGLFNDEWSTHYARYFTTLAMLARLRGAQVRTAGIGIEPVLTREGRALLGCFARLSGPVGVRDVGSGDRITAVGARDVRVGVDLGWLAAQQPPPSSAFPNRQGGPVITVTFAGESTEKGHRRVRLLVDSIKMLAARHPGLHLRMVAMARAEDPIHDDAYWFRELLRELPADMSPEIMRPRNSREAIAALATGDVSLGFRLHGLLLSYVSGVPACAISRSDKVSATFGHAPGVVVVAESTDPSIVAAHVSALLEWAPDAGFRAFLAQRREQARAHLLEIVEAGR